MLNEVWVYTKTSKIFIALLLLSVLLLATQNWQMALLFFIIVAATLVYVKRCDLTQEAKLRRHLDDLSAGVTAGTVYAVKNLPIGIVMADEHRRIAWMNDVFRVWVHRDVEEGMNFQDLVSGQRLSKIWGKTGWFDCHVGDHAFRVFHKFIDKGEENESPFTVYYFMDRSDVERKMKECMASMPVFCLIRIDNIPEVTVNMTDVEKSALLSEVTEKVLSAFNEKKGFIKKYGTSDFIACISTEALQQFMKEKFEILDDVRGVRTVNHIPVTLSMGIVQMNESFQKQFEEAQVSLDLALGRGGDQAIVRMGDDLKAFGGKAPTAVSHTRVRVRVIAQALRELIDNADQVLVMGHVHEDFDALGAAMGVTHMARASSIPTHIVLSKQDDTSKKMIRAIQETEGTEGLLITEGEAKSRMTDNTLVVVVDTHVPAMVAAPELLAKAKRRILIDHHRRAGTIIENTLLSYMEPSASSAAELVTELIQYYGGKENLTELEASCLYAGIVVDTKNFSVQTSVRTFDAASFLRRSGANTKLVGQLFAMNLDAVRVQSAILEKVRQVDGYMVFADCPKETENSQIIAGQIADFLVRVEGVRCSFLFYETEKGLCLSARSNGSVNVQVIMENLGGGGHQTVAGAQLGHEANKEEIEKKIIAIVRENTKEETA